MNAGTLAVLVLLAPPLLAAEAPAVRGVKVGERFHVSGCDGDTLVNREVSLWSKPGASIDTGATVVTRVKGGEVAGKCAGDVVTLREIQSVGEVEYARVETAGKKTGWVTARYVGKKKTK